MYTAHNLNTGHVHYQDPTQAEVLMQTLSQINEKDRDTIFYAPPTKIFKLQCIMQK